MLAICVECSHQRGMGHLFRALNLIHMLEHLQEPYVLIVNEDAGALRILEQWCIEAVTADLRDLTSDWEGALIREYQITVWLNDRLDTSYETARHVTDTGIPLYTIDDMGEGAALADGNFASLIFEDVERVPGRKVYAGCDYLILNPQIETYRRERSKVENILVTLGGSDTYGVTLRVMEYFRRHKELHKKITILLGPDAVIESEVRRAAEGTGFTVVSAVPSLICFLAEFDLAVTGGGVTALEAAASGLPCVVVANEIHEIQIGRYLERQGCALFAGYYKEMDLERITEIRDIGAMSRRGMETVSLSGAARICGIMGIGGMGI